jgi:hypothetical protein
VSREKNLFPGIDFDSRYKILIPGIDLDYRDAGERLKQRLTLLYGELPKAVHQRLMSIEIYEPAEPLQAP